MQEASGLSSDGGPELATAVASATTALERAKSGTDQDLLGVFTALVDADADLDVALDAARGALAQRKQLSLIHI